MTTVQVIDAALGGGLAVGFWGLGALLWRARHRRVVLPLAILAGLVGCAFAAATTGILCGWDGDLIRVPVWGTLLAWLLVVLVRLTIGGKR